MVDDHCLRTLHAEHNMICQAAYEGVSLRNSTIYLTARPCQVCTKLLIQVGVKAVHYWKAYNTDGVKDQVETMLEHADISIFGPYENM
jgi:dCMP deaminase